MATLTKKRPAPPEEAYEMEEGPDDEGEIRESSAGRKRRPKRSMDGDCSCGKRKGKCDGSCGKTMKDGGMYKKPMMDRGDALTPQEYLAACDLGIQGQPRSYIRARLDYAERLDLKCGKGAIPEGKKCTKGPATRVEGKTGGKRQPGRTAKSVGKAIGAVSALSTAAKAAGAVNAARRGNIAGAIGVGIQAAGQAKATREYWQGRIGKGLATEVAGNVAGLGTEIGLRSLNRTARSPGAQNAARRAGEATGRAVGGLRGRKGASYAAGRAAGSVARMGRRRSRAVPYGSGMPLARRGDAVWANGFSPEPVQLAV